MTRRVRIKSHAKTQRREERKRRALGIRAATNRKGAAETSRVEQPPFARPIFSMPLSADRRLGSCLIWYPKHFSFPPLESIVNLYTLRGCLTKNPSLSPMSPAGHFQDPFVFYEARISRSRFRVAGLAFRVPHSAFRVSDLLIHEKVKLLCLHRALSDCYGRIRTESRPIAWNRFNRSVGGKQR